MRERLISYLTREDLLSKIEAKEISTYFSTKNFEKGEKIIRERETCRHLYFVEKGCLRIYCIKEDGQEWTRYIAFENEFVTVIPSFVDQIASRSYLEAVESSNIFSISYLNFKHLCDKMPNWEKFYRFMLEKAYINSIKRIEELITKDSKSLYLTLQQEQPIMVNRLSNKILASYLGISAETLSRIKTKINNP